MNTEPEKKRDMPPPPRNNNSLVGREGVKKLFEYNVPLSVQRNVNASLIIDGDSLKKRDLQILAKRVKELIDAFEEEGQIRRDATWRNKDVDIPIIVISLPEKGEDGREYVAIDGSQSRIPVDEIEYEDEF